MDRNYGQIDEDVRKAGGERYNPSLSTDEQGIKSFVSELSRVFAKGFKYAASAWSDKKVEALKSEIGDRFLGKESSS